MGQFKGELIASLIIFSVCEVSEGWYSLSYLYFANAPYNLTETADMNRFLTVVDVSSTFLTICAT